MARALRYHPLFDCDVREAAGWYDRRSPGLGEAFVDLVSQSVAEIIDDPKRHAVGPIGCRYYRVPRFPYVVVLKVSNTLNRLDLAFHSIAIYWQPQ